MKFLFTRWKYVVLFLAVAAYAAMSLRGSKGITAVLAKQRQIEELEKRNAVLAQENERIRERIHRLADDPAEQELEIRQRLKLVRPGEKVYILNSK